MRKLRPAWPPVVRQAFRGWQRDRCGVATDSTRISEWMDGNDAIKREPARYGTSASVLGIAFGPEMRDPRGQPGKRPTGFESLCGPFPNSLTEAAQDPHSHPIASSSHHPFNEALKK